MTAGKMHDEELDIDESLVRRLLREQFPQWADLALQRLQSAGTDNAIYRLGDEMSVRLPRIFWSIEQVDKEQEWLPKIAPHLPLAVPVPLAKGRPNEDYPWNWSIYRWVEGENATIDRINDPIQMAQDLAQFIAALQRIDPAGGPTPGSHNSGRGVPLAMRDSQVKTALAQLHHLIDTETAAAVWKAALQASVWSKPPVWIHGDLQSGNLLIQQGRLSGVIDFGCLAVGDPACDLQVGWNLFSGKIRQVFRAALHVDEASWARGRGWALSVALTALPYYLHTNPVLVSISQHTIAEILDEYRQSV